MNGTFDERSQSSFDRAESAHLEPPEYPECRICDGTCRVEVASICDCDGKQHPWPNNTGVDVECPFCCKCFRNGGTNEREH